VAFGSNTIVSPASATGLEEEEVPYLSFTAQHSRVGLKGTAEVKGVKVGGTVEVDFFSNKNNFNTNPRLRQAYAQCIPVEGLDIRVGQQWDVFSPLNPTTNNTNANMWYTGNYGFRRPQLRLGYTIPLEGVKPGIDVCVAEGAKEGDAGPGADNLAEVPQFQGRLFVGFLDGYAIGASGLYGMFNDERDVATWGFAADVNLPIHALFALKGEFAMGQNLNNSNVFSIAGSGSKGDKRKSLGFWVNAISKPVDFFNIVVGYGMEKNTTEDLGDYVTSDYIPIESNMAFYSDLVFPIGKYFSLSVEYELLITQLTEEGMAGAIFEMLDKESKLKAHVIDFAGKIVF